MLVILIMSSLFLEIPNWIWCVTKYGFFKNFFVFHSTSKNTCNSEPTNANKHRFAFKHIFDVKILKIFYWSLIIHEVFFNLMINQLVLYIFFRLRLWPSLIWTTLLLSFLYTLYMYNHLRQHYYTLQMVFKIVQQRKYEKTTHR